MYLVFDIGGTKMRVAYSSDGNNFDEPLIVSTPQDVNEGMSVFRELVSRAAAGRVVHKVIGGVPGPLDPMRSKLLAAPHLSGWVKYPIKDALSAICKTEVLLENDAALVALGEASVGAGKGHRIVAYITVSTGVGGCRIVGGRIDENALGFEIGHQIIHTNGPVYLEDLISGAALEREHGKRVTEISDKLVFDKAAEYLAYGINNLIVHWSPNVVVIGGFLAHIIPLDLVRAHINRVVRIFPIKPPIERTVLGDTGGLHGALAYAKYIAI
ncbi:MAG: ROK family protein [Patescibacteria group bacterium]